MNVYVSKHDKNVFIENLKEIPTIDDYILDRERLGKEKIKIVSNENSIETIKNLINILPVNSMIVDQTEYPGKEYILCVGEVDKEDFSFLYEINSHFSIITMKEDTIRFNIWIHFSQIQYVFESGKIKEFSSINGKFEEKTFFIIESSIKNVNLIYAEVLKYSSEFIIRENKIYVKLFLHDFCKVYEKIEDYYNRIDVIDEDSF